MRPPSGMYEALGDAQAKQAWVDWLFSRVARRYDLGNDIMSAGMHRRWKRRLVAQARIEPEHRVLDLACGTGDVTFLVAERAHRGQVVGTDVNPDMLRLAEQRRQLELARRHGGSGLDHLAFTQADASALPFGDGSFDRVTCSYAGRGFPDWPAVLREAWRVLAPGGMFINLDFARPPNPLVDRGYRGYMMVSGAVLGAALHGDPKTYMYIPASMAHYPGQRWLDAQMREVGFDTQTVETRLCLMAFNQGIKPR